MKPGNTFLIPSGPSDLMHLFIVCSGPSDPPDFRLIVSISSIKKGKFHDPTCILEAGEHEFVTAPSFVAYRHAGQRTSGQIQRCIASGEFVPRADLGMKVLQRVMSGFDDSDFTEPWVFDFL